MTASPLRSGAQYIDSLRGRNLRVFFMGERVAEPVGYLTESLHGAGSPQAQIERAMKLDEKKGFAIALAGVGTEGAKS